MSPPVDSYYNKYHLACQGPSSPVIQPPGPLLQTSGSFPSGSSFSLPLTVCCIHTYQLSQSARRADIASHRFAHTLIYILGILRSGLCRRTCSPKIAKRFSAIRRCTLNVTVKFTGQPSIIPSHSGSRAHELHDYISLLVQLHHMEVYPGILRLTKASHCDEYGHALSNVLVCAVSHGLLNGAIMTGLLLVMCRGRVLQQGAMMRDEYGK